MAEVVFYGSCALIVLLAYLSLDIMGLLSRGNKFHVEGRTVLLTGGSQGMGLEVAKLLAQRGANLIIVARDLKKLQSALEAAKATAKDPSSQRFHIISADVTSEAENQRILDEATAWNNGHVPEIVWTNAGAAKPQLFLDTSFESMRQQMDINYWSHTYLAHKTLKAWFYPSTPYPAPSRSPKSNKIKSELPRHFVITSSSVAFASVAGYGPYAPAKTALKALADALRFEVMMYNGARRATSSTTTTTTTTTQLPAPFDVTIQIIYPGTISSPGLVEENKTKPEITHILEDADPVQSELEAAQAAIRGLEQGKFMVPTNWLGKLMRMSAIGGAPRDNIIVDTLGSWLASLAWLVILPDMESKTWKMGKKGMPALKKEA